MTFELKPLKPTDCLHLNFQADARVFRLTDGINGPIAGFQMNVRVKCQDCGLSFRFRGFDFGHSQTGPRLSIDGTELRSPIEPAYVTEIAGHPVIAGSA